VWTDARMACMSCWNSASMLAILVGADVSDIVESMVCTV
jgi:hypothetical protein